MINRYPVHEVDDFFDDLEYRTELLFKHKLWGQNGLDIIGASDQLIAEEFGLLEFDASVAEEVGFKHVSNSEAH